ncbi:MAG: 2-phospho-L-lactate guanylyltransferase [Dermatophilaceae bacterium]
MRREHAVDGRRGGVAAWRIPVIVPARGAAGKTRLAVPPGVDHAELARALALDTIEAARRARLVAHIVVVTPDATLADALPTSVRVVSEPGNADPAPSGWGTGATAPVADGLLAAVRAGLAACPPQAPAAVLLGDLPALRRGELDAALDAARVVIEGSGPAMAFVSDAAGTGTVLLVGALAAELWPRFGARSATAHARSAERLRGAWPGLRRDVDDAQDLVEAVRLGVGEHTLRALSRAVRDGRAQ